MKSFFCFALSIILLHISATAQPTVSPWNLQELYKTPLVYPADSCKRAGFESFFYEGAVYKTKPTKVFAYYKTPEGKVPPGGWPAVICVHGGGGTAFPEWVQAWVDRGYAALSMDVEGHLPKGEFPNREWHADGGPPRITTFGDIEIADREQWFYHAVADVIRANSLLRSFTEINKNNIGIHGISWGGVITSAVIGLDNRLSFAIPVYGCGFLYESTVSNFERYFKVMTPSQLDAYKTKWDPSLYIPYAKMPVLWYIGSNDGSFPLNIWQKSAQLGKSPRYMSIPVTSEHGHIWNQPEIFAFADMVVKKGKLLVDINSPILQKNTASVIINNTVAIKKAVLCYTEDTGDWQNRKWLQIPAVVAKKNKVSAPVPKNVTAFYFNITDDRKLTLSSSYLNIESTK
ncbi:MAG: acetylxylan esterase [Agriterribacter sp.]